MGHLAPLIYIMVDISLHHHLLKTRLSGLAQSDLQHPAIRALRNLQRTELRRRRQWHLDPRRQTCRSHRVLKFGQQKVRQCLLGITGSQNPVRRRTAELDL